MVAARPARSLAWLLVALSTAVPARSQTALAGPENAPPRDARVRSEVSPCLNLRISPSAQSGIVDCLPPGLPLTLFESREGWSRVRLERGLQGWVATRFLEVPPVGRTVAPATELETLPAPDAPGPAVSEPPVPRPAGDGDAAIEIARLRAELASSRETEARLRRQLEDAGLPEAELLEEVVRLRVVVGDLERELEEVRRVELQLRDQLAAATGDDLEANRREPTLVAVRPPLALESPEPPSQEEPTVPVDTGVVWMAPAEPLAPEALGGLVGAWASAWSDRRVDDYLSFYAAAFEPQDRATRDSWEAARRGALGGDGWLAIGVESLEIAPPSPTGEVEVRFVQTIETGTSSDRVSKRLVFVPEDGAWRIVREEVLETDS